MMVGKWDESLRVKAAKHEDSARFWPRTLLVHFRAAVTRFELEFGNVLRRGVGLGFTMCALGACSGGTTPTQIPGNWSRVDAGPFTFLAPPDVRATPLNGEPVDSFVRKFRGQAVDLMFDYGLYSNPLSGEAHGNFHSHGETIDGRTATLVSYTAKPEGEFRFQYFVAVHFPHTRESKLRLTAYASCAGVLSCRDAEDLFRSIRIK
jgi:hypothetical protein